MLPPRPRWIPVILGLLLLFAAPLMAPLAAAHAGHGAETSHDGAGGSSTPAPAPRGGITASNTDFTSSPWLAPYHESVVWGNATKLPLPPGMKPTALRATSTWLGWLAQGPIPGRTNVYLYDVATAKGYFATNDTDPKTHFLLGEDAAVWSVVANGRTQFYVHRISQGLTSPLHNETARVGEAVIGNGQIAYTRPPTGENSVVLVDLMTGTSKVASQGSGRRESLAFAGDLLCWRDVAYSLPDIACHRVSSGGFDYLTRDVQEERGITSDGRSFFYLRSTENGQTTIDVWYPDTERVLASNARISSRFEMKASEDIAYLRGVNAAGSNFFLVNPRNGQFSEIAWTLNLTGDWAVSRKVIYYVHDEKGTFELVAFKPSPVTELREPALVLPGATTGIYRFSPYKIQGFLSIPDGWGRLRDIRYRTDGTDNWTVVPNPGLNFTFDVNPQAYGPGSARFQVVARFHDAPPIHEYTIQYFSRIPRPPPDFDAIRDLQPPSTLEVILRNPGTIATIVLGSLLALLYVVRLVLRIRHRPGAVEYVRPEEDLPVSGNPGWPGRNP